MRIVEAKYIDQYRIELHLDNGKIQEVNLESWLQKTLHPEIKKYIDLKLFKNFTLVSGFLSWGNGEMELDSESLIN
jgi:hypothetical protein